MSHPFSSLVLAAAVLSANWAFAGGNIVRHSNTWEEGYVIGQPVTIHTNTGIISSPEIEIKVGAFEDDPTYIGNNFKMSIGRGGDWLIERFKRISETQPGKNFVFKYVKVITPVLTYDTHYFVSDILDTQSGEFEKAAGAKSADSEIGRHGYNSGGTTHGRITTVERWGFLNPVCAIEVNMSGVHQSAEGSSGSHDKSFAVYDEAACKFAEKLLFYQIPVDITYSQDLVELYDTYDSVAHKIQIGARSDGSLDQLRQKLEQELLNDPAFIEKVRQRVSAPRQDK